MSRHPKLDAFLTSPEALRLSALCLTFIAVDQLNDPLVGATLYEELGYWFARVAALVLGMILTIWIVSFLPSERWNRPAWLRPIVLVTSIGVVPLVCVEALLEPHLPIRPEFVDDDLRAVSPVLAFVAEYFTMMTILLPTHYLLWLLIESKVSKATSETSTPITTTKHRPIPPFLQRTSATTAEEVLALKAEEHYVKVHTDRGEELVHYRFSEAMEEMPKDLGLQVHRSWWVSENAVSFAARGSRRWQVELTTGLRVPISDSFVGVVRERGLLNRRATQEGQATVA